MNKFRKISLKRSTLPGSALNKKIKKKSEKVVKKQKTPPGKRGSPLHYIQSHQRFHCRPQL